MKKTRLFFVLMTVVVVIAMLSINSFAATLSGTALTVVDFSSEQDDPENIDDDYEADFAVDGDTETFWNNQYNPEAGGEPPHFIVIDLGSSVTLTGFAYLPRQDGYNGVENGDLGDYEVYVGNDSAALTTLSHSGTMGAFAGTSLVSATFTTPATGRYVKIVAPTQRWISIAELEFYTQAAAPQTGDSLVAVIAAVMAASAAAVVLISRKALKA